LVGSGLGSPSHMQFSDRRLFSWPFKNPVNLQNPKRAAFVCLLADFFSVIDSIFYHRNEWRTQGQFVVSFARASNLFVGRFQSRPRRNICGMRAARGASRRSARNMFVARMSRR
jgi:hypothetical protein